jgi:hypothetical protein
MICNLCENPIDKYNPDFNHLVIDEHHAIDICPECVDKFAKWQSKIYAVLFPTHTMKKIYGSEKQ